MFSGGIERDQWQDQLLYKKQSQKLVNIWARYLSIYQT